MLTRHMSPVDRSALPCARSLLTTQGVRSGCHNGFEIGSRSLFQGYPGGENRLQRSSRRSVQQGKNTPFATESPL
jgi:hypothetical protein